MALLLVAAVRPSRADELSWIAIDALPPTDRAIALRLVEGGVDETDRRPFSVVSERSRAAQLPLDNGTDLLFVETPSWGNCGEYRLDAFGPADSSGNRAKLWSPCVSEFRIVGIGNRGMPDIAVAIGDLADDVYAWNGLTWSKSRTVESLKPTATSSADDGPYDSLKRFLGTYDVVSVLKEFELRARLQRGLADSYVTWLRNLSVRGPWNFENGCMTVIGQAPHAGGSSMAALAICLRQATVHAVVVEGGRAILFSPATQPTGIPGALLELLHQTMGATFQRNANFSWVH